MINICPASSRVQPYKLCLQTNWLFCGFSACPIKLLSGVTAGIKNWQCLFLAGSWCWTSLEWSKTLHCIQEGPFGLKSRSNKQTTGWPPKMTYQHPCVGSRIGNVVCLFVAGSWWWTSWGWTKPLSGGGIELPTQQREVNPALVLNKQTKKPLWKYFMTYLRGIKNWQCHLSVCGGKLVVNQLRMNQTSFFIGPHAVPKAHFFSLLLISCQP